jgi:hypothetical protein
MCVAKHASVHVYILNQRPQLALGSLRLGEFAFFLQGLVTERWISEHGGGCSSGASGRGTSSNPPALSALLG